MFVWIEKRFIYKFSCKQKAQPIYKLWCTSLVGWRPMYYLFMSPELRSSGLTARLVFIRANFLFSFPPHFSSKLKEPWGFKSHSNRHGVWVWPSFFKASQEERQRWDRSRRGLPKEHWRVIGFVFTSRCVCSWRWGSIHFRVDDQVYLFSPLFFSLLQKN